MLGVEPGAVTPFGAHQRHGTAASRVVLDAAMMAHATLNYHPLVNTMTTSIARDDLVKFLDATGHEPRIEPVAGARRRRADRDPIAFGRFPAHLIG